MTVDQDAVPVPYRPNLTDLLRQGSDQPVTCTAQALLNALILRKADVSQVASQELIQKTLTTKAPLTYEDEEAFAQAHGYTVEQWRLRASEITTPENIAIQFAARLEADGPVIISISSALSKRDRDVKTTVSFDENPDHRGKLVIHRVVAAREGNIVRIYDSYDPQRPEEFDMFDSTEQIRLTAWLVSAGIHNNANIEAPGIQLDRSQILQRAETWLNTLFNPMQAMTHIITANVENLIPLLPFDRQSAFDRILSNTNDLGEGTSSLERKRRLVREIYSQSLLSTEILRQYPTVYPGSYTDIDFPLALGCRHIILIDPALAEPARVDDIKIRIEAIRGENSVNQIDNTLTFMFNFGEGDEQVIVEIVPKYFNPEKMNKNHPFYDPSQDISDEQVYELPDNVGLLLGFQSHFTQIQTPDLQKIVRGGYIINNEIASVNPHFTQEDNDQLDEDDITPENLQQILQQKYSTLGLDTIKLGSWQDYRYTFLKKQ